MKQTNPECGTFYKKMFLVSSKSQYMGGKLIRNDKCHVWTFTEFYFKKKTENILEKIDDNSIRIKNLSKCILVPTKSSLFKAVHHTPKWKENCPHIIAEVLWSHIHCKWWSRLWFEAEEENWSGSLIKWHCLLQLVPFFPIPWKKL